MNRPSNSAAAIGAALADLLHLGTEEERHDFREALHSSLLARSLAVLDETMIDEDLALDAAQAWANKRLGWIGQKISVVVDDGDDTVQRLAEDPDGYRRLLEALGIDPDEDDEDDEDEDPTATP